MLLHDRINAFVQLGKFLSDFQEPGEWKGYQNGVSQSDFDEFTEAIEKAHHHNGWFTSAQVRLALSGITGWLTPVTLQNWLSQYAPEPRSRSTVAVIMAGNIPLVGFHDVMSVLLTGHTVLCKFSSDDNLLMPLILKYLVQIDPRFGERIRVANNRLTAFHAVIATGSNNSSRYFESYFGRYPHVIRKSRTSVAVLGGDETEEELQHLGSDIFNYYGLGCRNVGKLFIPRDYDLDRVFKAIFPFQHVIQHNKYANNYDYYKALYLLNKEDLIENGFILFKEDTGLFSPLAVMFYERYDNKSELIKTLTAQASSLQCIVGHGYVPFGKSQHPAIHDYADGADTLQFLSTLSV